mmetsp:Transcript_34704/g.84502  ORF Transcript_34704/g.84502 Transcript_34704/m.84502 type:complete len:285 (+) Transcript_34704:5934-6788(+)
MPVRYGVLRNALAPRARRQRPRHALCAMRLRAAVALVRDIFQKLMMLPVELHVLVRVAENVLHLRPRVDLRAELAGSPVVHQHKVLMVCVDARPEARVGLVLAVHVNPAVVVLLLLSTLLAQERLPPDQSPPRRDPEHGNEVAVPPPGLSRLPHVLHHAGVGAPRDHHSLHRLGGAKDAALEYLQPVLVLEVEGSRGARERQHDVGLLHAPGLEALPHVVRVLLVLDLTPHVLGNAALANKLQSPRVAPLDLPARLVRPPRRGVRVGIGTLRTRVVFSVVGLVD